jgi:hypothetical protein
VVRQARERKLDLRSAVVALLVVAYVGHIYIRSIPTAGNDLVLIGLLTTVGLGLGVISGLATHVRAGEHGVALARVGWLAGALLVLGITARVAFEFAVTHSAHHAIVSFSIAHHISAAAWPVALVAMALAEVSTRIGIVQVRGHRVTRQARPAHTTLPGIAA